MSLTKQTRRESYENLDVETLYKNIKDVLAGGIKLTAREIAEILYWRGVVVYPVRQAVAPRLTELVDKGIVEVVGKIHDTQTGRNVAVYRLVKK